MIYIISIIFTLLFVIYSKWQFSDDRAETSGKWHGWGMAMRITFFIGCFLVQKFPASWQDYLLAGSISIIAWEIGINMIALLQKWYYVGATAEFDKKLGMKKWLLMGIVLIITILIKIFI